MGPSSNDSTIGRRVARVAVPLLLLLATGVTFGRSLPGTLIWDDLALIRDNRYVSDLRNIGRAFTTAYWDLAPGAWVHRNRWANIYYRPVVMVSFMLDHQVYGGRVWGFHLTNLLLHLALVLMAYRIAQGLLALHARSFPDPARARAPTWVAAVAALFFAVHPSRVEAVTWISGRTELFLGLFGLVALVLFHRALVGSGRRRWLALAGGWLAYLAALCSKETAMALGVVVLAMDWLLVSHGQPGRLRRNALWCHLPLLGFTLLHLVGRLLLTRWLLAPRPGLPLDQHATIVLQTVAHYGLLVVSPYRPSMQVGAMAIPAAPDWGLVAIGGGILLAWGLGIWLGLRRGRPVLAFLALAAGVGLAPVCNLVLLRIHVLAAERFLYLPWLPLAVLAAIGLGRLGGVGGRRALAALSLAGLLAVSWGLTAGEREVDFSDPVRFWTAELASSPGNSLALMYLGDTLADAGRGPEAERCYFMALRGLSKVKAPGYNHSKTLVRFLELRMMRTSELNVSFLEGLAEFLDKLVDLSDGKKPMRLTLQLEEGRVIVDGRKDSIREWLDKFRTPLLNLLTSVRSRLGQDREAIAALERARRARPKRRELLKNGVLVLARARRLEEAQELLDLARRRTPDSREVKDLAETLRRAEPRIRALRELGPSQQDSAKAHRLFAELYMAVKAPLRACRHLKRLIELAPEDRQPRAMLAMELAANGALDQALRVVARARQDFGSEAGLDRLERRAREAYLRWQERVTASSARRQESPPTS